MRELSVKLSTKALDLLAWLAQPRRYGFLWQSGEHQMIERRHHEKGVTSIFRIEGRDRGTNLAPWAELKQNGLTSRKADQIRITMKGLQALKESN